MRKKVAEAHAKVLEKHAATFAKLAAHDAEPMTEAEVDAFFEKAATHGDP